MFKIKPVFLLMLMSIMLLLSACNLILKPADTTPPLLEPVDEANLVQTEVVIEPVIEVEAGIPVMLNCMGDFTVPTLTYPILEVIDPEAPHTFTWTDHCNALNYNIKVHRMPSSTGPTYVHETFTTTDGEYINTIDLDPMTSYVWNIMVIPHDGESNWKATDYSSFTTGPICEDTELVAPILISPADGTTNSGKGWGDTTEVHTIIQWLPESPCIPDNITIEVNDAADFTGGNHNIGTSPFFVAGNPGDVRLVEDDTNSLEDCTTYFWRAYASSDTVTGPYSETFSFYTDFEGDCLFSMIYQAHIDANCRRDPWINGNEVGVIRKGETALLLGRDENAWWGKFRLDNGLECWVHFSTVDPQPEGTVFDPSLMPLLEYTPMPESTADDDDDSGGGGRQPTTACWVPDYSNPTHVGKTCVSPCPDPKYASDVCEP